LYQAFLPAGPKHRDEVHPMVPPTRQTGFETFQA